MKRTAAVAVACSALVGSRQAVSAFTTTTTTTSSSSLAPNYQHHAFHQRPTTTARKASTLQDEQQDSVTTGASTIIEPNSSQQPETNGFLQSLQEKIGTVDESRYLFPEYQEGEATRMFSSLQYTSAQQDQELASQRAEGSLVGAVALIAGTTVGAGVLALPSATIQAGFLPSTFGMVSAYVYMTMSGLLIAELTLNRMVQTGKPGLGLLELYESSLGKSWSSLGTAAYFFLHYAVMVAYIAQGGKNMEQLFPGVLEASGMNGSIFFTAIASVTLFSASTNAVEKVNNFLVLGVAVAFMSIVGIAAGHADWGALIDTSNQHPEQVLSCLPIIFLSLVYQNVVPTVVTNLEGDRSKITKAIVGGTTLPMLFFLAWNAVCLGNVLATGADVSDPVALLQAGEIGNTVLLGPLVTGFSVLALVTSVVGFTYGLLDAWTDKFRLPMKGEEFEKWKPGLFALVFIPPLVLSQSDPGIFYRALDYGGAFGVSTLFLVLPPLMVWQERYHDDKPLATKPLVPFGKIPLASMWKTAGTLIVEQGAEKLGVFDWAGEVWEQFQANGNLLTN
mmetsp:Transcript_14120/g.39012  ORF Transcript_14120/g.39012 Transcript_14120/m.39012 type:complete len:562 (-) Transcript_14120:1627-3312(-)